MQKLKQILSEIILRKKFYQTNIFSGTTSFSEVYIALRNIFKRKLTYSHFIDEYEHKFAQKLGVQNSFSFLTGRMALYAILESLYIKKGDEIILPAFTCVVVPNAIIYLGAIPVYCDIETERFGPDPKSIEQKISPKTKAILAQHTFGIPCLIQEINELGKKYDIPVIEDCAHSLGAKVDGKILGTLGTASFFSTDHTKVISTGVGGVALGLEPKCDKNIKSIQEKASYLTKKQIRHQLITFVVFHILTHPRIYWLSKYFLAGLIKTKLAFFITDYLSLTKPSAYPFPARLDSTHSQIGISQLEKLESNLKQRNSIAKKFEDITKANASIFANEKLENVWLRYPILVENRDEFLKDTFKNYDCGIWFTTVTECRKSNFHEVNYQKGSCPIAEKVTNQIVSLPTHFRMKPLEPLLTMLAKLKKNNNNTFTYVRNK